MKPGIIIKILTALIIISCAFFISGCKDIYDFEEGFGYITLNRSAGRTILPYVSYEAYTLVFESKGKPRVTLNWTRSDMEENSQPIKLKAGIWSFKIYAYENAEKEVLAAEASGNGIKVTNGKSTPVTVFLKINIESGTGYFLWEIRHEDANITFASMTITPHDTKTGTPEKTYYFINDEVSELLPLNNTEQDDNGALLFPFLLNTGYYTVNFCFSDGNKDFFREEYLHIYKDKRSLFKWNVDSIYLVYDFIVTNGNDSGIGSLRDAISKANSGSLIAISHAVKTIQLESGLTIGKNLKIRGYGVTLTRRTTWVTADSGTSLMSVIQTEPPIETDEPEFPTGQVDLEISGINFNGGKANNGGAIYVENSSAVITLESCIFSVNSAVNGRGGAIYNTGSLIVKACTFYGNNSSDEGGAIMNSGGTLSITGNIFYGNMSYSNRYDIAGSDYAGTTVSEGFNFADRDFGTAYTQSGWDGDYNDKKLSLLPFSPSTFRLSLESPVTSEENFFVIRPDNYPSNDFYGDSIPESDAFSGAVQSKITGKGFLLDVIYNNRMGNVVIFGNADEEMLYSGNIRIAATAITGSEFDHWKVNESDQLYPTYQFTIRQHTKVEAFFRQIQVVHTVNNFNDSGESYDTPGTLRYALENAGQGDLIRFSQVRPGIDVIQLSEPLPLISNDLTIEGYGITIAGNPSWTAGDKNNHILWIDDSDANVKISRVHFKNGKTSDRGAAIRNIGKLTLVSCIFSGNEVALDGGAIWNEEGDLTVTGCTFYQNKASNGGAIGTYEGILTLSGNLFYGNIVSAEPDEGYSVIYDSDESAEIISLGYNVIDINFGKNDPSSCGWHPSAGDTTFTQLGITGMPFTSAFTPVFELRSLITASVLTGFPVEDFNGAARDRPCAPGAIK